MNALEMEAASFFVLATPTQLSPGCLSLQTMMAVGSVHVPSVASADAANCPWKLVQSTSPKLATLSFCFHVWEPGTSRVLIVTPCAPRTVSAGTTPRFRFLYP